MDTQLALKVRLEKDRKHIYNRSRTCLFENCQKVAIGSHVLQKRPIINSIVDSTNHFYTIKNSTLFESTAEQHFSIVKVGIDNGYKFPGFCNEHDTAIFKDIETHPVDLFNTRNQALFTYRTICLELRKQHFYLETCESLLAAHKAIEPHKIHYSNFDGAKLAIKDLVFFKKELEAELRTGVFRNNLLTTVELPEKKICFSASLTIHDPKNKHTWEYDEYGRTKTTPLAPTTLNYFPYIGKSYIILATHKAFPCYWTKRLIENLKNTSSIDKIISDILTYRLEFWGISPDLYESIPEAKKIQFMRESEKNYDNFNFDINTTFNLFN
jgi:hypothetical protein